MEFQSKQVIVENLLQNWFCFSGRCLPNFQTAIFEIIHRKFQPHLIKIRTIKPAVKAHKLCILANLPLYVSSSGFLENNVFLAFGVAVNTN